VGKGIFNGIRGEQNYFLIATGVIFAGWSLSNFVSAKRFRQK
jgi:hypothetical protein